MAENEHEERARAIKATKLARVCSHLVDERPDLDASAFRDASPELRARIAAVAGTRVPSDETWKLVVAITEQHITERTER